MTFQLQSDFQPSGDQPQAIKGLVESLGRGEQHQTLLGVTGSGKTFSIANVIAKTQRPTLVISHNKTLAAQLAAEFSEFFPKNAVHYYVSYYDYYQPESYIARTDTYIEKETQINEEIDRLRHASTQAALTRRDCIIVASVSCIYGLSAPTEYLAASTLVELGSMTREQLLIRLVELNFNRNDTEFTRGSFRVRGDVVEVYQTASEHSAIRFDFFGNDLDGMAEVDVLTGEVEQQLTSVRLFPATLYFAEEGSVQRAVAAIRADLEVELAAMKAAGKDFEARRLEQRTKYDIEMLENVGYVNGIENYSRYFDGRVPGDRPYTLLDYFPDDFLTVIDESHQTVPQIGAMHAGDRSRKTMLVDYGFRLKAAFDNRPLQFSEFEQLVGQTVYVSATPGAYEKQHATTTVEQLIRPTGIIEPAITIRPTSGQIPDLLTKIQIRVNNRQRTLVTTLTKRMAEELADYLNEHGIAVQYIHSDVDTMERLEILRDLRLGKYDVLVGINLLREGLDLPEVSLVAILDADKEGFLRSETSMIQTMGRAARHLEGQVIMYADRITGSMQRAIKEVDRRRTIQEEYNRKNNITPTQIQRKVGDGRFSGKKAAEIEVDFAKDAIDKMSRSDREQLLGQLRAQMEAASQALDFELAAQLRDQIIVLEERVAEPHFKKKR